MNAKITFRLAWCVSRGHDGYRMRTRVETRVRGWGRRGGRGVGRGVGRERVGGRRGKERKSGEDGVSKYKKKTVGDQPLGI